MMSISHFHLVALPGRMAEFFSLFLRVYSYFLTGF